MSSLLPPPATAGRPRTSRKLVTIGTILVASALFVYSTRPSLSSYSTLNTDALDRLLEQGASSTPIGIIPPAPSDPGGLGLTPLGAVADATYHLGATDPTKYREELESFVSTAFPQKYREQAITSLKTYLTTSTSAKPQFPEIPHHIFQTAKDKDPNKWTEWKDQEGYKYRFLNDIAADAWVKRQFAGSRVLWTWDHLPSGILKSDFLRYLLVMAEGGIYTDTDTRLLRPIDKWGRIPEVSEPPSIIVGVEADVGDRKDWHDWWPRPLQICQWTIASAPFHPVLIDVVRRIHDYTVTVEAYRESHQIPNGDAGNAQINQLLDKKGSPFGIMEWTGPGTFTDSVIRYLAAGHQIQWPALKSLRRPLRMRDIAILPVTGFSPGVGLFGAGDTRNEQAMVQHWFAGSWKDKQFNNHGG